jgi:ABC-type sugar transport system ATPase subunit
MGQPLLEVRGISKSFGGVHAVQGVSFGIHHAEVVAIVGDNGAGKSTLIKMISGAYKRDQGEILWEGQPVQIGAPEDARRLGIETMYQDLALVGDVDAAGNIFLGREPMTRLFGLIPVLDRKAMRLESKRLLDRVKIQLPDLDVPVRQLSGGQRQATAIARFLLNDHARCIIMDEPTAALGVQESRKVTDLIRRLKAEGITVIVISHNLEHVFSVSDKIMVLRGGRLAGVRDTHTSTKQQIVSLIMGAEA